MCCWLFASGGGSGCATGDPCCCVCAPFVGVFSLEANCLCFSNKCNRKWGTMSCCYGGVACGADCGIAWVIEEVGHFPENFPKY